ncbi:MAG: DUF5688 family protein [Eubacteriales bacterium]|nr:DUF5688 family protein [Eubacteriales bacterium]
MVYETFLSSITERLQRELGDNYQLSIHKIPKINGVTLDGLCIHSGASSLSPAIYLNSYFEQYEQGMSMDDIIQDILNLYRTTILPDTIDGSKLSQLDQVQSRILFKLIHADTNQELLEDIPHIRYLDLAIVFYLYLEHSAAGQLTAIIRKEHMKHWNVKVKDLWGFALANTPRTFPAEIRSMTELIKDMARERLGDDFDEELIDALLLNEDEVAPLYVLSNLIGLNGAACMLYQNILKDFADSIGSDLLILPSSIHEVLITPNIYGASYEDLSNLVTAINRHEVPPEDHLSNQVYLYTRHNDRIRIVSHGQGTVGEAFCH